MEGRLSLKYTHPFVHLGLYKNNLNNVERSKTVTNRNSEGIPLHPHTFYIPSSLTKLEGIVGNCFMDVKPFHHILIVWGGEGILSIDEEQHLVSRGSVLLWNPSLGLDWRLQSFTQLQGILVGYRCLTTDGSKPQAIESDGPYQHCSPKIIRLAMEFENAWKNPNDKKPLYMQQLFIELLSEIYKELKPKNHSVISWLDQVVDFIDTHYDEDLTREQMAILAQVSPEHFSRAFHTHIGQTFNSYLNLLRIRNAQERLLLDTPNLTNLAKEVGYSEGTYLSRKFKQVVGLSPIAYHNKSKRIVALNANHTAILLALGVTPILGVYSPWLEGERQVEQVQKLNAWKNGVSSIFENIASVNPDLIINYDAAGENKSFLSLAPVIGIPFMDMSWREQFRLIAHIVGRKKLVEEWLDDYDKMICSYNQELNLHYEERGTAIVWEIGTHSAYCFNSSYGRGSQILYEDLGFNLPISLHHQGIERKGYIEVEIEAIVEYPADHIFITEMPSDPLANKRMNHLFASDLWVNLEAVKKKQFYVIEKSDLFYGYDPLSSYAQLHELMRLLTS